MYLPLAATPRQRTPLFAKEASRFSIFPPTAPCLSPAGNPSRNQECILVFPAASCSKRVSKVRSTEPYSVRPALESYRHRGVQANIGTNSLPFACAAHQANRNIDSTV